MLFSWSVALCTQWLAHKSWKPQSIFYPGTTVSIGGRCNGPPWWSYCVALENRRSWNSPWLIISGAWSYCIELKGKSTRTGSSSIWGMGKDEAITASAATTVTCRWMPNRAVLDATMVNEFDNGFVEKGSWNFKKEDQGTYIWTL